MINWRLKRLLAENKITQAKLIEEAALALKVKKGTIRNVLTGHKVSKRTEDYLSARLGTSRDDLFVSFRHGRILPKNKVTCK